MEKSSQEKLKLKLEKWWDERWTDVNYGYKRWRKEWWMLDDMKDKNCE